MEDVGRGVLKGLVKPFDDAEMSNLRAFRVKRETQKVHFEMIDVVNLKMHR